MKINEFENDPSPYYKLIFSNKETLSSDTTVHYNHLATLLGIFLSRLREIKFGILILGFQIMSKECKNVDA